MTVDIVHAGCSMTALLRCSTWTLRKLSRRPITPHFQQNRLLVGCQVQSGSFSIMQRWCGGLLGRKGEERAPVRPAAAGNRSVWFQASVNGLSRKVRHNKKEHRHTAADGAKASGEKPVMLRFYATCHPGLEQVVAQELGSPLIGAQDIVVGKAGVQFSSDMRVGMRANLWLRCAIRVLLLMAEGSLDGSAYKRGGDELYEFIRGAVDWPRFLPRGHTFSVVAHLGVGNRDLSNSHFVATRVKDAICDAIRDAKGYKPEAPRVEGATLPLHVTVHHDEVLLYRNMSGASLHRRGYRDVMHRACLNEAAAAGLLMLADWPQISKQEGAVLADPMCGSGTILTEAALMAHCIAPGTFRSHWPFLDWPDTDRKLWSNCLEAAESAKCPWTGSILGNDIHQGALSLASRDIQRAGFAEPLIRLSNQDCQQWQPQHPPTLVVTNPPWGVRLLPASPSRGMDMRPGGMSMYPTQGRGGPNMPDEPHPDAVAAWDALSACLKGSCTGGTAYVLCGNAKLTRQLRMKAARKYPITIGGVETRLLKYEVFPAFRRAAGVPQASTPTLN